MSTADAENFPGSRFESEHPEIYASLETAFDEFWSALPDDITVRMPEERRKRLFEREVAFVDTVYSTVTQFAAERGGQTTLLLDVDNTLVKNVYGRDDEITTYVRPGFAVLVQALDAALGDRLDIGILTTRAQSHLDEELASPTYLKAAAGKINPDFVISSRDGALVTTEEELRNIPSAMAFGEEALVLQAVGRIINPKLVPAIEADDRSAIAKIVDRAQWYDARLAILQFLSKKYPDRGFVFVDDLPFPNAIDPQNDQVRGVSLGNASFYLR